MAVVLQVQVRLTDSSKPPSGDLISKTPMLFEALFVFTLFWDRSLIGLRRAFQFSSNDFVARIF
jgi:hypothetical protein